MKQKNKNNSIEEQIINNNLRITKPRKIIAQVLENATDHPDVAEIHRRAHAFDKNISIATVYRTLRLLHNIGVLGRHNFSSESSNGSKGRWRFDPNVTHDHYHLIDVETGKVIEFKSEALDALQKNIAKKYGYTLQSQKIELYGVPQQPKNAKIKTRKNA